ncbi:hypothetical protein A3K63_02995 [Candidatus Micrarchaeota archaeon RBG_16_49_10]|nr:MAG: hypothetical protein A3K63_02995 [Candidatus Micrarchaeota archaeon RBG_16_49_10]
MSEVTVMLGLHDNTFREGIQMYLDNMGYRHASPGPEEIVGEARRGGYTGILMDANYGKHGSPDTSIAERVCEARGAAVFLAICGREEAVEKLQKAGIPCILKRPSDRKPIYDFFDGLGPGV